MTRYRNVLLVLLGYVAAFLAAAGATAVRMATTNGPDAQAAGGMYGFGDLLLFLAVFLLCALVPTAVGIYLLIKRFIRPAR